MTQYEIDPDRCVQTGNCVEIAPSLFAADDDGVVTSKDSAQGPDEEKRLQDAAAACPALAIMLHK